MSEITQAPEVNEPKATPAPENKFVVTEAIANEILNMIATSRLTWAEANPIITLMRNNFKPLPTA